MDFETAIINVYGNGKFYILFTAAISIFTSILAFELQSIVFLGFMNDFVCSDERVLYATNHTWISRRTFDKIITDQDFSQVINDNKSLKQCYALITNRTGKSWPIICEKFTYDFSVMQKTLTSDFNLVCDREIYVSSLTMATMVAVALGYFLAVFTDRYRRRRVIIFYMVFEIFWSLLTPFSTNLTMIFTCRIMRMLSIPLSFIAIGTLYEILPADKRTIYGNFYWIPYSLGYLATAGLAYLTRDWKLFRYYGLCALIVYIPLFILLIESPRWLFVHGKYDEYHNILRKLAKWNGVKLPDGFIENLAEPTVDDTETESLLDLLRAPNVCKVLLVFCYDFGAICLCYFGLSTSVDSASDNVFWNVFILGMSELPSGITGWILCNYFNRRNSCILAAVFTISSFLLAPLVRPLSKSANIVIVIIGKLMVTVQFNIVLLHTAEYFPTTVRNMGFFLVLAFGNGIAGFAPFINNLSTVSPHLPGVVYASINITAVILVHFFLPNTKNCPLAQTIHQANALRRGMEKEWIQAMQKDQIEMRNIED